MGSVSMYSSLDVRPQKTYPPPRETEPKDRRGEQNSPAISDAVRDVTLLSSLSAANIRQLWGCYFTQPKHRRIRCNSVVMMKVTSLSLAENNYLLRECDFVRPYRAPWPVNHDGRSPFFFLGCQMDLKLTSLCLTLDFVHQQPRSSVDHSWFTCETPQDKFETASFHWLTPAWWWWWRGGGHACACVKLDFVDAIPVKLFHVTFHHYTENRAKVRFGAVLHM